MIEALTITQDSLKLILKTFSPQCVNCGYVNENTNIENQIETTQKHLDQMFKV